MKCARCKAEADYWNAENEPICENCWLGLEPEDIDDLEIAYGVGELALFGPDFR